MSGEGEPSAAPAPRRFKPKAPSPAPAAAAAAAAAVAEATAAPQSETQPGARADRARGPGRGAGRSAGRGAGGGRKGFVVPTGESFFTGGTTKPPEVKPPRAAAAAGSGRAPAQSSASAWADLGVEHVVAAPSIDKLKEVTKGKRKNKQSEQVIFGNDDESDNGFASDEDDGEEDVVMAEAEPRVRGAPKAFSELLPVTLPLGPRTLTARRALAEAPLLATSRDADALKEEEEANIFVVQLPSDLLLPKRGDAQSSSSSSSAGKDAAKRGSAAGAGASSSSGSNNSARATGPTGAGVDDSKPTLPPGHLGKLQVHASGKVSLVRDDGSRYRVHAGVNSSFAQFLAAVDLEQQIVAKNVAAAKASSGGPGGAGAGKSAPDRDKGSPQRKAGKASDAAAGAGAGAGAAAGAGAGAVAGTMRLMGALTRKWLVTPAYDIGTRAAGAGGAMAVDDD